MWTVPPDRLTSFVGAGRQVLVRRFGNAANRQLRQGFARKARRQLKQHGQRRRSWGQTLTQDVQIVPHSHQANREMRSSQWCCWGFKSARMRHMTLCHKVTLWHMKLCHKVSGFWCFKGSWCLRQGQTILGPLNHKDECITILWHVSSHSPSDSASHASHPSNPMSAATALRQSHILSTSHYRYIKLRKKLPPDIMYNFIWLTFLYHQFLTHNILNYNSTSLPI